MTSDLSVWAMITAAFAVCVSLTTAILDLWVWVRVARMCREEKKERAADGKNPQILQ